MTEEFVIGIIRTAATTAALCGGPLLLAALVVGLSVSLFQAVTQINEATLTFIPKIIAIGGLLLLLLPFILGKLTWFLTYMFTNLPNFIR